jgi:hypothetical protein
MSVDDVGGFPLRLQELGGETGQFQFLEITGVSTPYKIPGLSERAVLNVYKFSEGTFTVSSEFASVSAEIAPLVPG